MIRILAIGNSFSQDATAHLAQLAKAGGREAHVVNLYIGGCPLQLHWENAEADRAAYEQETNGAKDGKMVSIRQALAAADWDVVTLQQASHDSGLPETYEPYLHNLAAYVRERAPRAKLWMHETWAYETDSDHSAFGRYDHDQMTMYRALSSAYRAAAGSIGASLIPCGDIIQHLRTLPPFDYAHGGRSLCRDGFHMDMTYGRYTLAAAWYECLMGGDVRENPYVPVPEAEEDVLECIRSVVHDFCRRS